MTDDVYNEWSYACVFSQIYPMLFLGIENALAMKMPIIKLVRGR